MLVHLLLVVLGILAGGTAAAAPDGPAAAPGVTFNQGIARVLQQHCQECHRPGGSAPFELIKYEHVYQRRDKILEAVEKRRMPDGSRRDPLHLRRREAPMTVRDRIA